MVGLRAAPLILLNHHHRQRSSPFHIGTSFLFAQFLRWVQLVHSPPPRRLTELDCKGIGCSSLKSLLSLGREKMRNRIRFVG